METIQESLLVFRGVVCWSADSARREETIARLYYYEEAYYYENELSCTNLLLVFSTAVTPVGRAPSLR
jgi:hypothetical protein